MEQTIMEQENVKTVEQYFKFRAFDMLVPAHGKMEFPFIAPGLQYNGHLWDWDSYYSAVALMHICEYFKNDDDFDYARRRADVIAAAKGCVLNFLNTQGADGFIPIMTSEEILNDWTDRGVHWPNSDANQHKPFLAQSALNVSEYSGDYNWFNADKLCAYIDYYKREQFHSRSGLYVWKSDVMIGMDNNPTVYGMPYGSVGDIYLNSYMYAELKALAKLLKTIGDNRHSVYEQEAERLASAIRAECYDERDQIYYSVFVDLARMHTGKFHTGMPFFWKSLPIKIRIAPCFLPVMFGIATKEQAAAMISRHYRDEKWLSPHGFRSTASDERVYYLGGTSNPSNSLGPIWLIYNYMAFESLIIAGEKGEAKLLLQKIIANFARDIKKSGKVDECYNPDTGEAIMNQSFLSWNCLIIKMLEEIR